MRYLKTYEELNTGLKKGQVTSSGKVINIEGVGQIDLTGISFNTNPEQMMSEFAPLIKNWNSDFIKANLGNFSGQWLFTYQGRLFVLVKIGNWCMPFYYSSSGTSGKKIDWHYVFGVDIENDWIIKGGVTDSGEMFYSDFFTKNYQTEINRLEMMKSKLRVELQTTPNERDAIVSQLQSLRGKYVKSLDTIFRGFDVVGGMSPSGIIPNENYDYLLNAHLSILKHSS